jgi:hypothetical protein
MQTQTAHLRADAGYLAYQTSRSVAPFRYHTSMQFEAGCPVTPCHFNPGRKNVNVLNDVWTSKSTRIMDRSKTQTELFGTAPLRALGDGIRAYAETSNDLERRGWASIRCARPLTELSWLPYTLDYQFVDNAVETWHSRLHPRAGQGTRVGPVFALPGQIPQ